MEEEFIPYKEALALKELGFDENCFRYYRKNGELDLAPYSKAAGQLFITRTGAPIYQQAFRWLALNKGLSAGFHRGTSGKWMFEYWKHLGGANGWARGNGEYGFDTPEEVQLICLQQLIKIAKG